jgi:uncharacterized membrane protein
MIPTHKKLILRTWILASSVILAYTWYYNPNSFPQIPASFSIWITDLVSANTSEDVAIVGIIFGFVVSFVLVTCTTMSVIFICRWASSILADCSSGRS